MVRTQLRFDVAGRVVAVGLATACWLVTNDLAAQSSSPAAQPATQQPVTAADAAVTPGPIPPPAEAPPAAVAPPSPPPVAPAPAAPPPGRAAPPPPESQAPYGYEYPPPRGYYGDSERDRKPERPLVMDYMEGQPVPPGYTLVERRRKGLIITGSILFGISYGISLSVAAGDEYSNPYGWLALPVLGPLIASTQLKDCSEGDFSCDDKGAERGFLMFDTLTQGAGATMLILGLAYTKKVMIQNLAVDFSLRPVVVGNTRKLELAATF